MGKKALQDATVLIVDDNPTNLDVLSNYLNKCGYTTWVKKTGGEALELLKNHKPGMILLDIVMPGIDGFETCRRLKENDETKNIPVIFMTALTDTLDKVRGFELGAVDYITKPFQREEVLARVKAHLTIQTLQKDLQINNQELQAALEREKKMMEDLRLSLSLSLPHELRTPLTVILGFSSFLTSPERLPTSERIIEYGNAIYRNSLRLHRLIENTLLYANLKLLKYASSEDTTWRQEASFNIRRMITPLAQQQAEDAQRSTDLLLDLTETYARISPTNFEKIFTELLGNAFKYSQPGTPVEIKSVVSGNLWVLSIADKGRGMTKEQIANVGAYMQFDRQKHEQQGFGLGLVIAHLLAQLEGGMLSIESEPNQGTTVSLVLNCEGHAEHRARKEHFHWFDADLPERLLDTDKETSVKREIRGYIPLRHSKVKQPPEIDTKNSTTQLKIVVIDDTWENGEVLEKLLTPLGFKIIEAFDEFDGMNKTVQHYPELIFLDASAFAPGRSSAMAQIRRSSSLKRLRIIAISDKAEDAAQTKSLMAYCDTVLTRPVKMPDLVDALRLILGLQWTY